MSDYEHLIYEQRGPVAIITINRPERMNAIGPQTHRELIDAWDRFRADDTALVGVLTGAGEHAFCGGGCDLFGELLTRFFGSSAPGIEIACGRSVEISAKFAAISRQLRSESCTLSLDGP